MARTRGISRLVLVDTNVWLAYFLGVQPQCSESLRMIEACLASGTELVYAPTAPKDVFYIIQRELRRRQVEQVDGGDEQAKSNRGVSFAPAAWACVERMGELATAAPLGAAECELARMLRSKHGDYEDDLVIACAETVDARFVATFDEQLISRFSPVCVRPADVASAVSLLA